MLNFSLRWGTKVKKKKTRGADGSTRDGERAAGGTATETETETQTGVLTDRERRETGCSKHNLIEITHRGHRSETVHQSA